MERVKKNQWLSAVEGGERGMTGWDTEDFQGSKTTQYDTVMIDTCHDTFVQTHRMNNTLG